MSTDKIVNLTTNKNKIELEKHLRPQWSWKTLVFIVSTIVLLTIVSIDLEINFISLFSNSLNYFTDIL